MTYCYLALASLRNTEPAHRTVLLLRLRVVTQRATSGTRPSWVGHRSVRCGLLARPVRRRVGVVALDLGWNAGESDRGCCVRFDCDACCRAWWGLVLRVGGGTRSSSGLRLRDHRRDDVGACQVRAKPRDLAVRAQASFRNAGLAERESRFP